jgi:hypothetical protein
MSKRRFEVFEYRQVLARTCQGDFDPPRPLPVMANWQAPSGAIGVCRATASTRDFRHGTRTGARIRRCAPDVVLRDDDHPRLIRHDPYHQARWTSRLSAILNMSA